MLLRIYNFQNIVNMDIIKLFKNPSRENIFDLGEKRLQKLQAEGRYSCYRNTRATLRKFSLFMQGKRIPVNRITPEIIQNFQTFLSKQMGNSHNTIVENLKILSSLFAEAGLKNNPCEHIPFTREQTRRNYLLEDEIERIMSLRLREGSEMFAARDIFYVECRTGLRISDLLQLRWRDYDGRFIRIRMQKTRREVKVPVNEGAVRVFSRYRTLFTQPDDFVFPFLREESRLAEDLFSAARSLVYATARINLQLKKLAVRAGIPKSLSTHIGRHTFATMLLDKGASIYEIKELLGHQDIKVTQVYAHLMDKRMQELVEKLGK